MPFASASGLLLLAAGSLLAGCGAIANDQPSTAGTPPALATGSPLAPPPASVTPAATPEIEYTDFCARAEFTVVDWELPAVLTDSLQDRTITLRYRLPPGAEALLIWMGVAIEPEALTVGVLVASDPALAQAFPNADPRALVPSTIASDGFDLEIDGQTHTIRVHILLPTEQSYDGANEWRWSQFAEPPFEGGAPLVSARFRAGGVRVDLDGRHCTPRILPLP